MKNKILIFSCVMLLVVSCKKNESNSTASQSDTYLNVQAGSSWTYHDLNSSGATPVNTDYTLTSSSKDTLINSRSYHIYSYSYGGSQYLNLSGHDYYQYDSVPGAMGKIFERLYLKDNAAIGESWKQDISFTPAGFPTAIPVTITNSIAEKGISRTVNGTSYVNVIHVSATITSSVIPSGSLTSALDSYYAPKYGLIENTSIVHLNYLGNTENVNIQTKLTSAILK